MYSTTNTLAGSGFVLFPGSSCVHSSAATVDQHSFIFPPLSTEPFVNSKTKEEQRSSFEFTNHQQGYDKGRDEWVKNKAEHGSAFEFIINNKDTTKVRLRNRVEWLVRLPFIALQKTVKFISDQCQSVKS